MIFEKNEERTFLNLRNLKKRRNVLDINLREKDIERRRMRVIFEKNEERTFLNLRKRCFEIF